MKISFIKKSGTLFKKFYWREILACLLIIIGVYFFRKERKELQSIIPYLKASDNGWLLTAALVTGIFILLQSAMYVSSFAAIGQRLRWSKAIELFLKRAFLSVFLPGGGVSALAYIPRSLKQEVKERVKIHQASGLFAFAGMLSTLIIGLLVLLLPLQSSRHAGSSIAGLLVLTGLIALVAVVFRAIKKQTRLYRWIKGRSPGLAKQLLQITDTSVNSRQYGLTIISSVGVEVCGILHLYIAMLAVGAPASLAVAGLAYVISLLLMVASPFLKGIGAVELSIVYVLSNFNYSPVQALAIALIYRLFEFWLPMLSGLIAFFLKGKTLFLRLFPAVTIFLLGIVNIFTLATIAPEEGHTKLLARFIPLTAISASNALIVYISVALLVTSAFLIRGLRNAWWMALLFTILSAVVNLTKGLDWQEALLALLVVICLVFTQNQYTARSNRRLVNKAVTAALLTFGAVIIYGFVGFYFLEKRHFNIDFTWRQSFIHTLRSFLLLQTDELQPLTRFGREFINSIRMLGLGAWLFLLYAIVKPYLYRLPSADQEREKAMQLLQQYGRSAVDYFKIADDKQFFFLKQQEGFIAYRTKGGFAIALETPVCAHENMQAALQEFDLYCNQHGLKPVYYRVDEDNIEVFRAVKMKPLLIGQEAISDVQTFDIKGRDKKALRNSLNSLQKKGYTTAIFPAPHSEPLLQSLKMVSDEWLDAYDKKEMSFAQGSFEAEEIRHHDLIITSDSEGQPVAFLNIIPDFAEGECTYDLIRKTDDAPGGCMDALIIELIRYARERGYRYLNLGLAPMSGLQQADNMPEELMKYAYEKIRRFRHYHGLRNFKDKYASHWQNKYLIYEHDFDLVQLPMALNKVMNP